MEHAYVIYFTDGFASLNDAQIVTQTDEDNIHLVGLPINEVTELLENDFILSRIVD